MDGFGLDVLANYLRENSVSYDVIEHRITHTAAAEGRVSGVPTDDVAKTVVLHADGSYYLAVIPASERLDMQKARNTFGEVRMASEEEMQNDFRFFEVGAVPPFGQLIDAQEAIDQRLLTHERVLCSGGDHRHSILVNPHEIVRLANPRINDLCQD